MIDQFQGLYRFLSNFWLVTVEYNGQTYISAEHAYQAAKATCFQDTHRIMQCLTPVQAKRLGGQIKMRKDWEEVKVTVMLEILRAKFTQDPQMQAWLLNTGDHDLVEGNKWGDTFWGVCNGHGRNMLGKLLMQVRNEIRSTINTT